jgi:hypothetical protein
MREIRSERVGVQVEGKDRTMMQLASRGDGARAPALAWLADTRPPKAWSTAAPKDHDDLSLI